MNAPSMVFWHEVYDILEKEGGAPESMRLNFLHAHCPVTEADDPGCEEYRFQGKLGFGGKYRSVTNKVDYYPEDHTPELDKLVEKLNAYLRSALDHEITRQDVEEQENSGC